MGRQRGGAQPTKLTKLTGFCDIVNQAKLKKTGGKTSSAKPTAAMTKTTTAKTIERTKTTTTSVASTKSKSADKWEEFREKKLAEMKQHKINVERRMQTSCNIDGQMYWSQRTDKLKRYPKHEALHPSWYTENIYSNHSIDLESDDFFANDDQYGPNDYDRETSFHRKKPHIDTGYGYPKSRSCCFGSGYDERPKPVLMPKSSSFTGTGGSRGVSNFRTMYSTVEEESFLEVRRQNNSRNNLSGLRKFYCWENDRQPSIDKDELYANSHNHLDVDCYMKNPEVYQIERDRNYYKKPNVDIHDVQATTNANYIRNIWHNRNRSSSLYKVQNINEINGNYLEDFSNIPSYDVAPKRHHHDLDSHHPFEEEYLIIHQNKPNINLYSARNSFDDPGSVSRRQSYHSNEMYASDMDPYSERSCYMGRDKNCMDMSLGHATNRDHQTTRHSIRSKSMLEVQPPSHWDDDTSSDSTIDDLYDFNFDFVNQYDLDYRNNNNATKSMLLAKNSSHPLYKEKNINVDNYSKYRKSNMDIIDDTDNDINDVDFDNNSQSDEDEDINFNSLTSPRHDRSRYHHHHQHQSSQDNEYLLSNRSARARYYDNCLSSTSEFYPTISSNINNNNNQNVISPNGNRTINEGHHQINNMHSDDNKINNNNNNNNNVDSLDDGNANINSQESNGAISLINNIFSIYKPRKYSPVSCRAASQKACGITKSMNVPSTVRPLGAPYNDFLTSMKRPLTITPSCFTTQKRNWIMPPTASVDQAHFKIIPEKTGLKISPLYRFGYEDDSKLRLKCTARPLLFPL
ncbi:homeobox protein 2-like [Sitodiplosis mosellana]|uniref:homeobox protein 2-like n=1 Tax=Sitodiplosis mosellana TaxID=263140 RepID=UPI002444B59D|nr:homeobox protein 2-like [Sitodiplosis mosellana]